MAHGVSICAQEYWSYCGEIESMDLMRFPGTGNFNGTMFVTFCTEDAYQVAACLGAPWLRKNSPTFLLVIAVVVNSHPQTCSPMSIHAAVCML